MKDHAPVEATELQRSSRDPDAVHARFEQWLRRLLGAEADATVPEWAGTTANGMSSDTVLFRADWNEHGERRAHDLVARIAPDPADVPVFPVYDMRQQFDTIRTVAELTDVPVPAVRWCETDPSAIGAPFFVMDRVEGQVPPDVMPYNFGDSWLYDATPAQQQRLRDRTVEVLAALHAIDRPAERFDFLAYTEPGATNLRRRLARLHGWYAFARDHHHSALIEQGFAWLEEHFPAIDETHLCWGDARIGNCMYRDFTPVAVLDWEMACLGPRELDLAWMVYAHRVFEDIAAQMNLGGMPDFLRLEDVAGTYEKLTGYTPRALEWFTAFAAAQYGVVFLRTGLRSVHFGERPMPDDVDELLINGETIRRMVTDTYWT